MFCLEKKKKPKKPKSSVSLFNYKTTIEMHMLNKKIKNQNLVQATKGILCCSPNSGKNEKEKKNLYKKEKLQKQKRIVNQLYYTTKNECL